MSVSESQGGPRKSLPLAEKSPVVSQTLRLPVLLGCDWGREVWCEVVRLLGRSSELCTLGLIEPGDCGCRLLLSSPRCDLGLVMRLREKMEKSLIRIVLTAGISRE